MPTQQDVDSAVLQDAKTDYLIWQNRWEALRRTMDLLIDKYSTADGSNPALREVLCYLVLYLKEFADAQFNFFLNGFEEAKLVISDDQKYPENALSIITSQVGHDLEVIRRAIEQRAAFPRMASALETTDRLAYLALQPAIKAGRIVEPTTVLTYFEKSPSIRVLPYASVMLIGVPFTVADTDAPVYRDYLAIPHEVGHYVYWHSKYGAIDVEGTGHDLIFVHKQLRKEVPETKYSAWLEEIFADVYGCIVGGPVMALDFQDLQLEFDQEKFFKDDGKHPTPVIRPKVYLKTLNEFGLQAAPARLGNRWVLKTKDRKPIKRTTPSGWKLQLLDSIEQLLAPKRKIATVQEVDADFDTTVGAVIRQVFDQLLFGVRNDQASLWWDGDSANYGDFGEAKIRELVARAGSKNLLQKPTQHTWTTWAQQFFSNGRIPVGDERVEEKEWTELLSARGWTTEGPQSDPSSG